MALKSTIFKLDISISDLDRHYYGSHQLMIARHPSEKDERMMLRIAVFALHAHDQLVFTKGLSTVDEPDLWQKNDTDEIDLWIDLGQPDEKRIRKACGKSKMVYLYCYSTRSAQIWWDQTEKKLHRFENLRVNHIAENTVKQLAAMAQKTMVLQCTIQDRIMWLSDGESSIEVRTDEWKFAR